MGSSPVSQNRVESKAKKWSPLNFDLSFHYYKFLYIIGSDFVNRKVQWNHDKNKTSIMNDFLSITNYYFVP